MYLSELNQAMQELGVQTQLIYANELSEAQFRIYLKNAMKHEQYVIVNFLRTQLHQSGKGHFSPIAAYDEKTDRFLILDVARYKYPPFWVKTSDLWESVNTKDGYNYRGFIIISFPLQTSDGESL